MRIDSRISRTSVALAVWVMVGMIAGALAFGADEWFFVKDAPKNAVLGQMANQPQAVRAGSYTYVAYQGISYDPYVVRRNNASGVWGMQVRAGTNPLPVDDNHGAPALLIDNEGYVHVFFGSHHTPLLHRRGQAAGSISKWVNASSVGTETTYPQIVRTPLAPLLFYRERASGDFDWRMTGAIETSPSVETTVVMLSDYPLDMYPSFREGTGGDTHVAWVEVDWYEYTKQKIWGRHDLFYMNRDASGVWRNAASEIVTLPVTPQKARASCLVTDTADAFTNIPVSGVDDLGRPAILYTTGLGTGPDSYTWRYAVWTGSEWRFTTVCTTDHFFDSGTWRLETDGTITAFIETGLTDGSGRDGIFYDDLGGSVHRFTSDDDGLTWDDLGPIDPEEPGDLYHNAHIVADGSGASQVIFQQWNNDSSIEAFGLYLWGSDGLMGKTFFPEVTRLAGHDRFEAAATIGLKAFPQGTSTVVIASGEVFADAMVAAPLAKALGAPILLVKRDSLPGYTKSAIRTLGAKTAVIVGGPNTISVDVMDALRGAGINSLSRVWGQNRYETAKAVAYELEKMVGRSSVAYVASGEKWPDGLSVGALAALQGAPVLLTPANRVQDPTLQALATLDPDETIVLGGPNSVSEEVFGLLGADIRIQGHDRYEVAANIAEYGMSHGYMPRRAIVATGRDYPDSLTSSVLAARLKGPVLLVRPSTLPEPIAKHLSAYAEDRLDIWVCGGEASVGAAVFAAIENAVELP